MFAMPSSEIIGNLQTSMALVVKGRELSGSERPLLLRSLPEESGHPLTPNRHQAPDTPLAAHLVVVIVWVGAPCLGSESLCVGHEPKQDSGSQTKVYWSLLWPFREPTQPLIWSRQGATRSDAWTPKVCKIIAFLAVYDWFGRHLHTFRVQAGV